MKYIDKILHLNVNYAIVKIADYLHYPLIGIGIAILVSVGKELYDKYVQKEQFDWTDVVADVNGMLLAIL